MSSSENKTHEKVSLEIDLIKDKSKLTRATEKATIISLLKQEVYTQLEKEVSDYNKRETDISNTEGYRQEITFKELKTELDKNVFDSDKFVAHYDSIAKTYSFNKLYEDIVVDVYQREFEISSDSETVTLLRKLFNQIDDEVNEFNEDDRFGGFDLESSSLKLQLLKGFKEGKELHETYSDFVSRFKFSKSFADVSNMVLYYGMNIDSKNTTSKSNSEKEKNTERTVDDVFSHLSFAEREALTLVVSLISLRKEADMSVKELSKKSGVSKKYIKGLEGSTKKFKVKKIIKLANALGMQLKFVKR